MSDNDKSKFVLFFDGSANEVNRKPMLTGEYRLAGEATTSRLAYWAGQGQNGKLYARGKATPADIAQAMRAQAAAQDVPGPEGIDLKVGETVIFENAKATAENKQPHFFGYTREAGRFVRHAGWNRGGTITGTSEPYRPAPKGAAPDDAAPGTGG
jgi:hypothetical protein